MTKIKFPHWALINAAATYLYILLVGWFMSNVEHMFDPKPSFWAPVAFLLLFVFSATMTGLLVLGRPIYIYLNGQKKEAWHLLFWTIGWIFVGGVITFIALAL